MRHTLLSFALYHPPITQLHSQQPALTLTNVTCDSDLSLYSVHCTLHQVSQLVGAGVRSLALLALLHPRHLDRILPGQSRSQRRLLEASIAGLDARYVKFC